jgi:malonyl-CoA/methylmalonyl-CoA synthetase
MNVMYRERELRHILGDAEPRVVVTDDEGATHLAPGTRAVGVEEVNAAATSWERRSFSPLAATDPALIIYTSGTTGTAKGAVLTHGNLIANGRTLTDFWKITERDRYLALLPLFHVHGLGNGVHTWLASGNTMRLEPRFDQKTIGRVLKEFRPTVFFGVPTMYVRMLEASVVSDDDATDIGRDARLFVSGSAPLPAHIHQAFKSKFGQMVLERYGMSEALMIMSNPYDGERRAGSVGPPLPGVSARLVGDDGQPLGDDAVGEVEIKSPMLFKEYWRRPDATVAAFHDGWFKTGDVGIRSKDGYYTLRGRKGDLIISGGFNIYPREIEELLLENPKVREAAVVGFTDPVRGEVPIAYIVAEDGLEVAKLEEMCRDQLASFKVPRRFILVEALPRTALGKVQKHLLPEPA